MKVPECCKYHVEDYQSEGLLGRPKFFKILALDCSLMTSSFRRPVNAQPFALRLRLWLAELHLFLAHRRYKIWWSRHVAKK
jgi:hypothetical protein